MTRFLLAVAALLAHNEAAHAVVTCNGVNVTKSTSDSRYLALGLNGSNTIMLDPMIASTGTFAFVDIGPGLQHFNIRYDIRDAINSMPPGTGIDFDYADGAPPSYANDQNHDYFRRPWRLHSREHFLVQSESQCERV